MKGKTDQTAYVPAVTAIITRGSKLAYVFAPPGVATRRNPDVPARRTGKKPEPELPPALQEVTNALAERYLVAGSVPAAVKGYRGHRDLEDLKHDALEAILETSRDYAAEIEAGAPEISPEKFKAKLQYAAANAVKRAGARSGVVVTDKRTRDERADYNTIRAATELAFRIAPGSATPAQIAQYTRRPLQEIEELEATAKSGGIISFDQTLAMDEEGNEETLADQVADEAISERRKLREMEQHVQKVTREALVPRDALFYDWYMKGYKVEKVGEKLGMSRTQAYATFRRIQGRLGIKLRHAKEE